MAFFEPPPVPVDPDEPEHIPEPWWGPPDDTLGMILPIGRLCVRTAHVVMVLTHATVHPTGCLLHVEGAMRRADLPEERWSALRESAVGHYQLRHGRLRELPDALRRFGVRFPDGAKATTLEQRSDDGSRPAEFVLTETHGGFGGRSERRGLFRQDLWLWPLPPAVPFEFAVEWPLAGIPLTIIELDGAAIATAALSSSPYWPDERPNG
jgi:hypothetical protein